MTYSLIHKDLCSSRNIVSANDGIRNSLPNHFGLIQCAILHPVLLLFHIHNLPNALDEIQTKYANGIAIRT